MNAKASKNDDWDACPPGELSRMVGRIQASRRKQSVVRGGIVSALTLVLAVTIWQALPSLTGETQHNYGGISCTEVQAALPHFLDDQLDEETSEKVRLHLAQCDMCRPKAEMMGWVAQRDPVLSNAVACNDATCPECQQQDQLIARGLIRQVETPQLLAVLGTLPSASHLE